MHRAVWVRIQKPVSQRYQFKSIIHGGINKSEQRWSSFKAHEYGNIENASFHCEVFWSEPGRAYGCNQSSPAASMQLYTASSVRYYDQARASDFVELNLISQHIFSRLCLRLAPVNFQLVPVIPDLLVQN